jgi:hypothetical protein
MRFFNFSNDETFHFFKWVSESGQVDPTALIADAYAKIKPEENVLDESCCVLARDILAERLQDIMNDALPLNTPSEACEIGVVRNDDESLWAPLLVIAAERICFVLVAQALLIQASKWAPDTDIPKMR